MSLHWCSSLLRFGNRLLRGVHDRDGRLRLLRLLLLDLLLLLFGLTELCLLSRSLVHVLEAILIELRHAVLISTCVFATICRLVFNQIKDIFKLLVKIDLSDDVWVVGGGGLLISIRLRN